MIELIAAIVVFILTHVIPTYGKLRQGLIERLGKRLYFILYSILSWSVIVWLGFAFIGGWAQPQGRPQRHREHSSADAPAWHCRCG